MRGMKGHAEEFSRIMHVQLYLSYNFWKLYKLNQVKKTLLFQTKW